MILVSFYLKTFLARKSIVISLLLMLFSVSIYAHAQQSISASLSRTQYFEKGFIVAGGAAKQPVKPNRPVPKPVAPVNNGGANAPNAGQPGSPVQKLPPPPVPPRGAKVPNAGQPGSPIQKLPKPPAAVPAKGANVPNAGQPGSPVQKLPPPPVPPRGTKVPNAGQPGSPIQKLPKAPVATPVRGANVPNAGQPGIPIQKLPKAPVATPVRGANVPNAGQPGSPTKKLPKTLATTPTRGASPSAVRPINTAQNTIKVFSSQLVKPFKRLVATYKHKGMVKNKYGEWIPKGNTGRLGQFLGGGYNSRVYRDQKNNKFVHKLVPLSSFKKDKNKVVDTTKVVDLKREGNITDQLGGRAILKRFKETYKGKGLDSMVQIAKMDGKTEVWSMKGPNGKVHQFAHTREQNISSPVFTKDSKGRQKAIKGDNGKFVLATNGLERVELRVKDKIRKQAKLNGQKIKFSDILGPSDTPIEGKKYKYVINEKDMSQSLTQKEELTINTVLRGMNHNGIAWTDHKLANLDVVKDPKSPTGHKVIFFDFDGFRAVKGNTRQERKNKAREIQTKFDHATRDRPANVSSADFDFTAFGGQSLITLQSPGANRFRENLSKLDRQSPEAFNKILNNATKGQVKTTSPNI